MANATELSVFFDGSTATPNKSYMSNTTSAAGPRGLPATDATQNNVQFISDEQKELATEILSVIHSIIAAMVVPLVVCNIVVFFQRNMRSTTGTYVIALSLGQLMYVVSQLIYTHIWPALDERPRGQQGYCIFYNYVTIYFGVHIARRGSHVIMCLASLERLYAVVRPLHIKNFFLSMRPVLAVVVTYLVLAAWHVHYVFKYDIVMTQRQASVECARQHTELYLDTMQVSDSFSLASSILYANVSLALILLINFLTVCALRRHTMATKHVQSSANEEARKQRERQLTITLLAATVTYVILALPANVVNHVATFIPEFGPRKAFANVYIVTKKLAFTLTVMACGVDFFCYLSLSTNYRRSLFRLFRCRRKGSANTDNAITEVDDLSKCERD